MSTSSKNKPGLSDVGHNSADSADFLQPSVAFSRVLIPRAKIASKTSVEKLHWQIAFRDYSSLRREGSGLAAVCCSDAKLRTRH